MKKYLVLGDRTFFITRISVLIALTLIAQYSILTAMAGNPAGVMIVGSIVNLMLYFSIYTTGLTGGLLISIITPIAATLTGHNKFPILLPFIVIANLILVLSFGLGRIPFQERFENKKAKLGADLIVGVVAGLLKTLFMYLMSKFVLKLFLGNYVENPQALPKILKFLVAGWSLPQLITAMIGFALCIVVYVTLRGKRIIEPKKLRKKKDNI